MFIIGQNGPTILVDIKKNKEGADECTIQGIKIANRGYNSKKNNEDKKYMGIVTETKKKNTKVSKNRTVQKKGSRISTFFIIF